MPRYRLIEAAYVKPSNYMQAARFEAGAVIEFDDEPSFGMEPLDADAIAAKAAFIRRRMSPGSGRFTPHQPPAGDRKSIIALSRSLGGPANGTVEEMADYIDTWLASHPAPE